MHDLEKAIRAWRKNLHRGGVDSPSADELESHLRDTIDELVASGSTEEHAFTAAVERLGETKEIAKEFQKVEKLLPVDWLFVVGIGLATFIVICKFLGFLAARIDSAGLQIDFLLGVHVGSLTIGFIGLLFLFGLGMYLTVRLAISSRYIGSLLRLIERTLAWTLAVGASLAGIGLVSGSIWSAENRGVLWSWDEKELGSLLALVWYLFAMLLLRRSGGRAGTVLGILLSAGVLVHFSWFVLGGMAFTIVSVIVAIGIVGLSVAGLIQSRKWWRKQSA